MAAIAPDPTTQRWLYGPVRDLLFGCGGSYLLLIGLLMLPVVSGWAGAWMSALAAALGLAINAPHYGATLLRVYQHREDREKYRLFAVWVSAALFALLAVATRSPWLGSLLVTLYVTWSPWHFAGQNYGLALMFLRRRGVDVTPTAKRLLYASFFLSFALTFFTIHGEDPSLSVAPVPAASQMDDSAYHLLSLGIPASVAAPAVWLLALAYLGALAGATREFLRSGRLRDLTPAFLLVLIQAAWFSVPAILRLTGTLTTSHLALSAVWISAAHSLQYLWVTSYYAKRTDEPEWFVRYLAKAMLSGAALLVIPALVFAPRALGVVPFASFAILLFSVINLHHFVLDGAVWKLRDGRVARALVRSVGVASEPGESRTPSWLRRGAIVAAWAGGLAALAVGAVGHWEHELGARALSQGNFPRAIAAADRLWTIGRENENRHTRLAYTMWQRGLSPRLVHAQYQRSLAIRPTATTWTYLGHFYLTPRLAGQRRFELEFELPSDAAYTRDPDAALLAFQNALSLDPTALSALVPLGLLHAEHGDLDQAQQTLARARALAPEDPAVVAFADRLASLRSDQ